MVDVTRVPEQSTSIAPGACNVLLIYPRFAGETFWNFAAACEIFGAKYPTSPLGLITVAALLPSSWNLRLVDRNVEELDDSDLDWADLVMTGGMLPQHDDLLEIINLCRARGKPVAIGGPAATSVPHFYARANFQVLGEVEDVIHDFIAAWEAGAREGVFQARKFEIDVRKTPIPRFDLLKFDRYLYVGVQFSRGCPFTCEFCDIIELYGRVPRTKSTPQMLAELDALYALGYRGHVDFVDDNLIGNKKAVKAFLPDLKKWLEAHDYPFEFTTEASLNLADDDELLRLMNEANFVGLFVGIESPDPETLVQMRKKQNTRRSIPESVHKINAAGMFVTAGFIVGFDNEKSGMADAMIELIEESSIPVCMVGLLYALPNTQLTRRLTKEGRLHPPPEFASSRADQCTLGLNYDTLRPRREILTDYRDILQKAYEPEAFAGRLRKLVTLLDNSTRVHQSATGDTRRKFQSTVARIIERLPGARDAFKQILVQCATSNPSSLRTIVTLMAFYLHLGPFSRHVIGQIDQRIAELDDEPARPLHLPRADDLMASREAAE
ncbi:MAG: B12-binding domain-containing radical SAM protein [Pseudorhodoplanes sp.]|uniref:B12-binding domain-containing radical SAM protein n=1 Tax=Pseudorhodoplanes sp. TaxID=1934341 RepID=UPI003D10CAF8